MSNGTKTLYQVFAAIMFCIAVSLLLFGYRSFMTVVASSSKVVEEQVIFEQKHELVEPFVKKGDLIAMLFTPLEYDIEIDGFYISKHEKVKDNLSSYPIADANYSKSYVYNEDGNIIRILYTPSVN